LGESGFYTPSTTSISSLHAQHSRKATSRLTDEPAAWASSSCDVEHDRGRKRSTLFDYESILKTRCEWRELSDGCVFAATEIAG